MKSYRALRVVKVAVIGVVALVVFGFVTMQLWNWLMPAVFGLHAITWVQALGLLVLCKILFGGFHRHGGGRPGWKRHMEERWEKMSPEERERFRAGMGGRWGCGFKPPSEPVSGSTQS
jgi:uncharacterized membrane protein